MSSKKYTKDIILKASYELSKDIGLDALSMRKIANKVGCSVMPLYEAFSSREELINGLSTFNEKLYDLSSHTMYDRYFRLLREGLRYPTFFLSVVKYDIKRVHEEETICNLCNLMKKDDRLKNLNDRQVYAINTRIEIYVIGLVYSYSFFEDAAERYPALKNILIQVIDGIIMGALKNINN